MIGSRLKLVRAASGLSLRALEQFLEELAPVEGSKSLVLFSAGLLTEDLTVLVNWKTEINRRAGVPQQ